MKNTTFRYFAFLGLLALSAATATAAEVTRERLLLDDNWQFKIGKPTDSQGKFDKAGFGPGLFKGTSVNLPHDWAVELPFANNSLRNMGYKAIGVDFRDNSIGWYAREFTVPSNAEEKVKVRPLKVYHGKVGRGVSVEMAVKHGPVTLLSVVESTGVKLKLLVTEGESVPGPILEIGNTNSSYRFSIGARRFVNDWNAQGPAHHCAIGVGHISGKLEKLAQLLEIEFVRVC